MWNNVGGRASINRKKAGIYERTFICFFTLGRHRKYLARKEELQMKKTAMFLSAVMFVLAAIPGAVALAANVEESSTMAYYYFGDDGAYKVSETQFNEIVENHNLNEVVARDGLTPVSQAIPASNYNSVDASAECAMTRTTGTWNINSYDLKAGYKVTWSMPDKTAFVVDDGEEVIFSITTTEEASLTVGATGTKDFEVTEYIDFDRVNGITIGTDTAGSYKFYNVNNNDYLITLDGGIVIK